VHTTDPDRRTAGSHGNLTGELPVDVKVPGLVEVDLRRSAIRGV